MKKFIIILLLITFLGAPIQAKAVSYRELNQQIIIVLQALIESIKSQILLLQQQLNELRIQEEAERIRGQVIIRQEEDYLEEVPETYLILICGSERYDSRYESWKPKFPLYTEQGFSAYRDIYEVNSLEAGGWITEYECREAIKVIQ